MRDMSYLNLKYQPTEKEIAERNEVILGKLSRIASRPSVLGQPSSVPKFESSFARNQRLQQKKIDEQNERILKRLVTTKGTLSGKTGTPSSVVIKGKRTNFVPSKPTTNCDKENSLRDLAVRACPDKHTL